jgi:antitoxin CptB
MRAGHRGMREMDLILGGYAARALPEMDAAALAAFEALMEEADADLLAWVMGQRPPPAAHAALVAAISREFPRL